MVLDDDIPDLGDIPNLLGKYVLDLRGNPKPEPDLLKWGQWFDTADRQVADDTLLPPAVPSEVRVSTIFLGIDHAWGGGPPVLWETMIFGDKSFFNDRQMRYTSREDALAGHKEMVEMILAAAKELRAN
jgi:hypothetical protein